MSVANIAIVAVIGLSAFFDLMARRIPNWLIVFGLLVGFAINLHQGVAPLLHSILGVGLGVVALFIPFALGWMGAGDVKYFGVLGALFGVGWLPRIFFYSAVSAGTIALFYAAVGHFSFGILKNTWADARLALITMGGVLPEPIRLKTGTASVPWGVAFAIGAVLAYYVDRNGHWAGF